MFTMTPFTAHMDSVFDMFGRHFPAVERTPQPRAFRADIRNEEDHYVIEAELPGYKKEDISLNLKDSVLTIKAEKSGESEEKSENGRFVRRERYFGTMARSFDVSGIDEEKISAAYENGILKLHLPKEQPIVPESRQIDIM